MKKLLIVLYTIGLFYSENLYCQKLTIEYGPKYEAKFPYCVGFFEVKDQGYVSLLTWGDGEFHDEGGVRPMPLVQVLNENLEVTKELQLDWKIQGEWRNFLEAKIIDQNLYLFYIKKNKIEENEIENGVLYSCRIDLVQMKELEEFPLMQLGDIALNQTDVVRLYFREIEGLYYIQYYRDGKNENVLLQLKHPINQSIEKDMQEYIDGLSIFKDPYGNSFELIETESSLQDDDNDMYLVAPNLIQSLKTNSVKNESKTLKVDHHRDNLIELTNDEKGNVLMIEWVFNNEVFDKYSFQKNIGVSKTTFDENINPTKDSVFFNFKPDLNYFPDSYLNKKESKLYPKTKNGLPSLGMCFPKVMQNGSLVFFSEFYMTRTLEHGSALENSNRVVEEQIFYHGPLYIFGDISNGKFDWQYKIEKRQLTRTRATRTSSFMDIEIGDYLYIIYNNFIEEEKREKYSNIKFNSSVGTFCTAINTKTGEKSEIFSSVNDLLVYTDALFYVNDKRFVFGYDGTKYAYGRIKIH